MKDLEFFIAGVQFRPREEINKAIKEMKVGDLLFLKLEPSNRFDPNAIQIIYNPDKSNSSGVFLGYVPKKYSAEVSAMIETSEREVVCEITHIDRSAPTYEMCKVKVYVQAVEEDLQPEEIFIPEGKE